MTEGDAKPKRRGRKPASAETKARRTLAFRIRAGLLEELERSAQKNGRSVSEEVEATLEKNYAELNLIDLFPNPENLEEIRKLNTTIIEINESNAFKNRMVNIFVDMLDFAKTAKNREIHDKAKSVALHVDDVGNLGIAFQIFANEYFNNNTIGENIDRARAEIEKNLKTD